MTKKKIVFFLSVPFDNFFLKKHLINDAKKYFDVRICNITNFYTKLQNPNSKNFNYMVNLKRIKKKLHSLKPEYGIMNTDDLFHQKLGKICKDEFNIKTVYMNINQCPESYQKLDSKLIFNTLFTKYIFYYLRNIFLKLLLSFSKLFKDYDKTNFKFDYAVTGGDIGFKMPSVYNSKKIIQSSSYDYQLSKKFKKSNKKKNISIFLDENLYSHRDYKIQKRTKRFVSKKYFTELDNFFNFFEKKFETEIIICVHPRVENINEYKKRFFNRKCYLGKSHELVKCSKNVILHPSTTSLNLPIIYNKPLIFLTTNELMKQLEWRTRIERRKLILNNNFINISNFKEETLPKNLFKINTQEYKSYMNKFIKCNESNRNSNAWKDFNLQKNI
jgi:hypothetical protein